MTARSCACGNVNVHHLLPTEASSARWNTALRSWKDNSFVPRIHGDADIAKIINDTVPEVAAVVHKFRALIERVDVARYALMYRDGGVYADADHELVSASRFCKAACSGGLVLPLEHVFEAIGGKLSRRVVVGQSVLLSGAPRHPFWRALIRHMALHYDPRCYEPLNTGPDALTRFVNKLCADASDEESGGGPLLSGKRATARALLTHLSIEEGFGDGRITRHFATGSWRTARRSKRGCKMEYASLDLRQCAPFIRRTYVDGLPPLPAPLGVQDEESEGRLEKRRPWSSSRPHRGGFIRSSFHASASASEGIASATSSSSDSSMWIVWVAITGVFLAYLIIWAIAVYHWGVACRG